MPRTGLRGSELTPSGLFLVTLVQPLFSYSPPDVTCIRETRSNHRSAHVASTSISETTLGHSGGRGIPHKPTIARCPSSARRLPTTPCDHFGIISARRNRNHQGPHSFTHSVTPSPCYSLPSRLPGPHGLRHSYALDSGRRGEAINLSRALARLEMAICLKIIIFDTTHSATGRAGGHDKQRSVLGVRRSFINSRPSTLSRRLRACDTSNLLHNIPHNLIGRTMPSSGSNHSHHPVPSGWTEISPTIFAVFVITVPLRVPTRVGTLHSDSLDVENDARSISLLSLSNRGC
ncbi:hypothetical protein BKA56DRAFT_217798 [Ilyonectria sp. MPI-CAGE-AT-0026]|nr:hypothetical protein BKA56DRAFT_217798 [Ilyonectria sp. MPI-CAGE-AT-0026]